MPSQRGASGKGLSKRAMPCASVVAVPSACPLQSEIWTCACATGRALSSVVTHTRALSRPRLKCTPRLVTRAEVRTYIVREAPRSGSSKAAPRLGEAISSTWKPGVSGMPTTSKGRGSPASARGKLKRRAGANPCSKDKVRVSTQCLLPSPTGGGTGVRDSARASLRSTDPRSKRSSRPSQAMMSASAFTASALTWPTGRACSGRSASTLRTVTGSSAWPSGSASRSITPNGEAANLASGGKGPVATSSGKAAALSTVRPASSTRSPGSITLKRAFSGKGGRNSTAFTWL